MCIYLLCNYVGILYTNFLILVYLVKFPYNNDLDIRIHMFDAHFYYIYFL